MYKPKKLIWITAFFALSGNVKAHCPLCTAGAAVAAGGAAWLGVSRAVIGIFIGAFAVSIGWWLSRVIKKKFIPFQKTAIILVSYLTTVIPLMPLLGGNEAVFVNLFGSYGSLFNRTYVVNSFLTGSILGGLIIPITPWLSKKISSYRDGKFLPFQGVLLTLLLLIILSITIEIIT